MGHIIEKEFYFRGYETLRIKGIWLRLRIKISPVLPTFFHPSMTIYCSPIYYRIEQTDVILASVSMRSISPCHYWLEKSLSLVHQFIIGNIGMITSLTPLSYFCRTQKSTREHCLAIPPPLFTDLQPLQFEVQM